MGRLMFDYAKLKGRITEKCDTQKAFASLMGLSETALTSKLSGKTNFSQVQILDAIRILEINPTDTATYFFTVRVQ